MVELFVRPRYSLQSLVHKLQTLQLDFCENFRDIFQEMIQEPHCESVGLIIDQALGVDLDNLVVDFAKLVRQVVAQDDPEVVPEMTDPFEFLPHVSDIILGQFVVGPGVLILEKIAVSAA